MTISRMGIGGSSCRDSLNLELWSLNLELSSVGKYLQTKKFLVFQSVTWCPLDLKRISSPRPDADLRESWQAKQARGRATP